MANELDRCMSRINERLMSCAQRTIDELGYILDDMECIAEQSHGREDIQACIEEVKAKTKKALTEAWATANHWSEHFDGLGGGEEADDGEEDESTEDTDGDNDEE